MFTCRVNEHITIRLLEPKDAERIAQLIIENQQRLGEWLFFAENPSSAETYRETIIPDWRREYADMNSIEAGLLYDGSLCGMIGLHHLDQINRKAEIGYWIAQEYEGKGIMTAACRTIITYAFKELELNRVALCAAVGNHKSRAIPERLGFQEEGIARDGLFVNGKYHDLVYYSLLKHEWKESK
ncbi:ribosomal N-acetyltransferase YdaF [Bacillus vallismortis]|uniref:GNAT family N-acetyltransferase n=1 Tax=Bacillus vallismortis TaxID=72361 RepID=UPI000C2A528F|nr:GNAT family protein [Bacillus vallismortis]PJY99211.1 ribosomal N-acetyltransferase YdaF [Bacillus vallismortis]